MIYEISHNKGFLEKYFQFPPQEVWESQTNDFDDFEGFNLGNTY